ncbi:MAG: acyl--CoA ligase [Coriobacteriaceae bacterium]|nr:acyl--CoA ligase [Coriobacteriaceae bacterium]
MYDMLCINEKKMPDKLALVFETQRCTYRDLRERVESFAERLAQAGIGRGMTVVLMRANTLEWVVTFYALLKLEARIAPLSGCLTTDEMAKALGVVRCQALVYDKAYQPAASKLEATDLEGLDILFVCAQDLPSSTGAPSKATNGQALNEGLFDKAAVPDDAMQRAASVPGIARRDPRPESPGTQSRDDMSKELPDLDETVLYIFTGGSTGALRAAKHSHFSLMMQFMSGLRNPVNQIADSIFLIYAPLFHLGGLSALLQTLARGNTVVLTQRFDAAQILGLIEAEKVTHLLLIPPSIVSRLWDVPERTYDLSSLEVVFLTGGSANEDTVRTVFDLCPQAQLFNGYGQTEQAARMTSLFSKAEFDADPGIVETVGYPDDFFEVRLLDEAGEEVGTGACGELWGKSPCMFTGYEPCTPVSLDGVGQGPRAKSPQEGADKLAGWFATGDIFCKDALGRYYFRGRKKNMIKSGGENVYAVEVERALTSYPLVKECVVLGLPHQLLGEMVVAAVILADSGPWGLGPVMPSLEAELIGFCAATIAGYKKPKRLFFLTDFPRTPSGKVDLSALRAHLRRLHEEFPHHDQGKPGAKEGKNKGEANIPLQSKNQVKECET